MSKRLLTLAVAVALIGGFGTACVSDSFGPDQQQIAPVDSDPFNPVDSDPLNEESQGSDS